MYNHTSSYTQQNILIKNLTNKVIGIGDHSINFVPITHNILNFFSLNTKNNIPQTLLPSVSFNNLSTIKKLNLMGFNFHGLKYLNTYLPLVKHADSLMTTHNYYSIYNHNTQLKIMLSGIVSIRSYIVYLTLLKVSNRV